MNFIPPFNPECPCCHSNYVEADEETPILTCFYCGYQWDYLRPISEFDISIYGHHWCKFNLVSGDQPSLLIE